MSKIAVHWFRRDLRIQDNPSLHYASENGSVMPIFILDTVNSGDYLGYDYIYDNFDIVKQQLFVAGYRLAGTLNKIFDE